VLLPDLELSEDDLSLFFLDSLGEVLTFASLDGEVLRSTRGAAFTSFAGGLTLTSLEGDGVLSRWGVTLISLCCAGR
jgi:hypothetical protein